MPLSTGHGVSAEAKQELEETAKEEVRNPAALFQASSCSFRPPLDPPLMMGSAAQSGWLRRWSRHIQLCSMGRTFGGIVFDSEFRVAKECAQGSPREGETSGRPPRLLHALIPWCSQQPHYFKSHVYHEIRLWLWRRQRRPTAAIADESCSEEAAAQVFCVHPVWDFPFAHGNIDVRCAPFVLPSQKKEAVAKAGEDYSEEEALLAQLRQELHPDKAGVEDAPTKDGDWK